MKSDVGEAQADEMLDDLRSECMAARVLMESPLDPLDIPRDMTVFDGIRTSSDAITRKFEALDEWIRDGYSLPSEWK